MKFFLIVNPHSGTKQSTHILNMVKPVFDLNSSELSIVETAFKGHAEELGKHLELDAYDGILVLGGDGTFHEVVNGILERTDGKTLPIGLIPGGSGNSLSRDLGILDPISAAKTITAGHFRPIDVAKVEMDHIVRYSINLIGWGLVTDVGQRAERLRWLGPRRYTVSSVIEILLRKTRKAKLVVDDETFIDRFTFIVACNSIHVGKGMKMAPYAHLDDGLIDLLVVDGNITRQRLFSVLPKLFDGSHVNEPELTYHQASKFSLIPETDDILNIDGEMVGSTPITVTTLKHAIQVFA